MGEVPVEDLYRTFNMGVGLVVGVAAARADEARDRMGADAIVVGEVIPGDRTVKLEGDPRW